MTQTYTDPQSAGEPAAGEEISAQWGKDTTTDIEIFNSVVVPVGACLPYSVGLAPPSAYWHLADGSSLSGTTYVTLYGLYEASGFPFGGSTSPPSFNLPDMRGMTVLGAATTVASPASVPRALGTRVGEENHTLSPAELAAHNHPITFSQNNVVYSPGALTYWSSSGSGPITGISGAGDATIGNNSPAGSPHNNLQPSLALAWIIRVL